MLTGGLPSSPLSTRKWKCNEKLKRRSQKVCGGLCRLVVCCISSAHFAAFRVRWTTCVLSVDRACGTVGTCQLLSALETI